MFEVARLIKLYRRSTRALIVAAAVVLLVFLVAFASLSALSHAAPPPVEHRTVDTDAAPDEVAFRAASNLRATEYRYRLVVKGALGDESLEPIATQETVIDNRAHTFRSRNRDGDAVENRSIPAVHYYGTVGSSYRKIPAGYSASAWSHPSDGSWERDTGFAYLPNRNAFENPERLRGASATVVAENDSTIVVRVTDTAVAIAVADQRASYSADNATANITLVVDRVTETPRSAVFHYHNRNRDHRIRITYRFEDVGRANPSRPLGTLPGNPLEPFSRADLGLRAVFGALGVTGDA